MPTAVLKALTTALPLLSNTIPSSSQAFIHHRIAAAAPSRSLHAAHNIPNAIMSYEQSIANHAESLSSRLIEATAPSAEEAVDILNALETETTTANNSNNKSNTTMTIAILESTKIGKLLTKTIKTCKRHKRGSDESSTWDTAIQTAQRLIDTYKKSADEEAARKQKQTKANSSAETMTTGLPTSASTYRQRLLSQKKELYKDPPVLPPSKVIVESEYVTTKPKRSKSGELSFAAGQDSKLALELKEFHPNRTPEEVLRAGAFGGTYYRPIVSSVTNIRYTSKEVLQSSVRPEWIEGLSSNMLSSSTYNIQINKYKAKCGGSLGMWESSGWISDVDPYGWFQWYCRFYMGRRCSDDARQISRWKKLAGERGRFKSQLCNKILAAGGLREGKDVSPVVRQTLLHWGLEITEEVLEKHRKRK